MTEQEWMTTVGTFLWLSYRIPPRKAMEKFREELNRWWSSGSYAWVAAAKIRTRWEG